MGLRLNIKTGLCLLALVSTSAFGGFQLDKIIKGVGAGAAVMKFGPQMNSAINKLSGHHDTDSATTKVVPIVSVGKSAAVGAAQVQGFKRNVDAVKAVAQIEGDVLGQIRIKALIPIATDGFSSPGNLKRVKGVGVSGVIDLRL